MHARLLAALFVVTLTMTAAARPVVDQESPYGTETIVVGADGGRNRIVAQTVTAGATGDLMRVELGIGCDGGALIIEIVNLAPGRSVPGTVVRSTTTIDAVSIPNPPAVRTFDLGRRPSMSSGDQFAIVLRNETGSCTALKGPLSLGGTSYPGGEGWFRPADGLPDAWLQFLDFGKTGDLGFKTIVNVPADSPPCIVNGFATPFPGWLPVCRCIEDDGLRDFRCALMHPSYFLFRNIPTPVHAGKPFEVKWTLVVLAPMKGVVEVSDEFPSGFTGVPKTPLTFFVDQVPAGGSLTLRYEVIAPAKPGHYRVESGVEEGTMKTVIEVVR
ncbi:MAG TPA: hypothetical protein VEK57_22255 [Thermoanaerobaculia bacterium]|nr:hypothetical protein [Thermoanaerobaculia bacterium]